MGLFTRGSWNLLLGIRLRIRMRIIVRLWVGVLLLRMRLRSSNRNLRYVLGLPFGVSRDWAAIDVPPSFDFEVSRLSRESSIIKPSLNIEIHRPWLTKTRVNWAATRRSSTRNGPKPSVGHAVGPVRI